MSICKKVNKWAMDGEERHKIPKMAITWLQLLVFYAKLLGRTQQRFDIMGTNLETVYDSRDQKKLEIGLA
jgi:hypothetical protein